MSANANGNTSVTTTIPATVETALQVEPVFTLQSGMLTKIVYPGLWQMNLFIGLSTLPANPVYFYQIIEIYDELSALVYTANGTNNPTRIISTATTMYTNSLFVNYTLPTNYKATSTLYVISPTSNTAQVIVTMNFNNSNTLSSMVTTGLGNAMDLNTTQTITGDKSFSGTTSISTITPITGKTTVNGNVVIGNSNIFTITQFFA